MKKINLKQWMKDIDDNTDVLSLNLPGTHDASACFINFSHFSKCQDKTIYEQLNSGVRVLDLRVSPLDSKRLGMVHGKCKARSNSTPLAPQLELCDVLLMCYNFLDLNPSETIVLQFKNDDGVEQEKCFELLCEEYIRKAPDRWYLENRSPYLSEVRGKIVLLRRCKKSDDYKDDKSGIDFSSWQEQDELVPDALTLTANTDTQFIIQDRYRYDGRDKWELVVKPFLDSMVPFECNYVINYLSTAGGVDGPKGNAEIVNMHFAEYPIDDGRYYGIIYLDFPTVDVLRKIIATNF